MQYKTCPIGSHQKSNDRYNRKGKNGQISQNSTNRRKKKHPTPQLERWDSFI